MAKTELDFKNHTGVGGTTSIRWTKELEAFLKRKAKELHEKGLIPKENVSAATRHIVGQMKKEEESNK